MASTSLTHTNERELIVSGYDGQSLRGVTGGPIPESVTEFFVRFSLTSAAAATPVSIIPDAMVGNGRKVYLQDHLLRVAGATNWATTANVKIQDTNGTPVDALTVLVAALTGNSRVTKGTANSTMEAAYTDGTGLTAGRGLQIRGDANGTGSTISGWVRGFIA